ncbi:MAG: hypothetical protein QXR48_03200 [Candidatus Woesearchaeota archaeon]
MQKPIIGVVYENAFPMHCQGFITWAEKHQLPVTAVLLESLADSKTPELREKLEDLLMSTNSRFDRDVILHSKDSQRSIVLLKCKAPYAVHLFDKFLSGIKEPEVAAYIQEYVPVPATPEPEKTFWRRARELVRPEKPKPIATYSAEAEGLYNALSNGLDACKAKLGIFIKKMSGCSDYSAKVDCSGAG